VEARGLPEVEARVVISDWRDDHNHHRPHSALSMLAPAVFAATWTPDTGARRLGADLDTVPPGPTP
jgi:hypothetical protein